MDDELLTLQQAAEKLKLSQSYLYEKCEEIGFFQIGGKKDRKYGRWRIKKSDLDHFIKTSQNSRRLSVQIGDKHRKENLCRSENQSTVSFTSILPHQQVNAFEDLVKQLTGDLHKNSTIK